MRGLFKDVKVRGKRALKGRLSGEVSILLAMGRGPASRRLQGNGKRAARDGELTNLYLIKKIRRVTGMIGLPKTNGVRPRRFRKWKRILFSAAGNAAFTRLYPVNPQMEVSGDGTMTIEQPTLDLAISTGLSPQVSARAARGRMTSYFKDKQAVSWCRGKFAGQWKIRLDLNAGKVADSGLPQNVEKGFSSFFLHLFRSR